jgi:hypothetical protein
MISTVTHNGRTLTVYYSDDNSHDLDMAMVSDNDLILMVDSVQEFIDAQVNFINTGSISSAVCYAETPLFLRLQAH